MRVQVKICGITNFHDALSAVRLGVDALGFVFAPSPRQIAPQEARVIVRSLPPFVQTVGVFVNEDPTAITEITHICGLDLIQLHGDEPPEVCSAFMPLTIKAFQLKDSVSLQSIKPYRGKVRAFLFDTYSKGKRGGTGETFDWDLAIKGKRLGVPIILSGGITPSNMESAIYRVKPHAIDVNSGIEAGLGKKSPVLMRKLMQTARRIAVGGSVHD
jgi:phosphoribosylanthranilate isomerase